MKSNSRYLGVLVMAPFIVFIFLGGMYLKLFTIALSTFGLYEFYKTTKVNNMKPIPVAGYIMLLLYYLTGNNFNILSVIIILGGFLLLTVPIINIEYTYVDVAITILGFIYVGIFFSFITLVNQKVGGQYLVWLIFLACWSCDSVAYYTGRAFGKHKLCPKVSPKKTIEGSLGGILGSTLVCGIYGIIISSRVPEVSIIHYFIIGILCGVFCQFGDLVASSIKRYAGVKDYSNLIPGHGGILDRFDSVLFAGVVIFFYLSLIVLI